jgi:hypothetical protein
MAKHHIIPFHELGANRFIWFKAVDTTNWWYVSHTLANPLWEALPTKTPAKAFDNWKGWLTYQAAEEALYYAWLQVHPIESISTPNQVTKISLRDENIQLGKQLEERSEELRQLRTFFNRQSETIREFQESEAKLVAHNQTLENRAKVLKECNENQLTQIRELREEVGKLTSKNAILETSNTNQASTILRLQKEKEAKELEAKIKSPVSAIWGDGTLTVDSNGSWQWKALAPNKFGPK